MEANLSGKTLGSYRLTRFLARGGMGHVYEAEHTLLATKAAVKVIDPTYSARPEAVARFFNEAKAATSAQHPGITRVYDFGYHDAGAYLVMELLQGETLQERLTDRDRLPVDEAIVIARQIASAMAAAHAAGVIHRDLKPENIFLLRDDESPDLVRVKILDFGVAKLDQQSGGGVRATRTGQLLGTPLYMSPEQCNGTADLDARTDIYALGCILYDMLVGHPPFDHEGVGEIIAAHLYEIPKPPSEIVAGIPSALEEILLSLLAKRPSDRPSTMRQVEVLLESARHGRPRPITAPPIAISVPSVDVAPARAQNRLRHLSWVGAAAAGVVLYVGLSAPKTLQAAAPSLPDLTAPAPVAAPTPAPAPATVHVRIVSRPAGAEVIRDLDGASLGKTPLDLELPAWQTPFTVTLRKSGHRQETLAVSAVTDSEMRVVMGRSKKAESRKLVKLPRGAIKDGALDPFTL